MIDKHSTIEEEKGLGANKHPKLPAKRWEVCQTPTTIVDQFLFYECCESPPLDAQKTIKNPQKKTGRFTRPNHIMGLQPLIPKSGDRRFPWQEPTKTPVPSAYNLVVQA